MNTNDTSVQKHQTIELICEYGLLKGQIDSLIFYSHHLSYVPVIKTSDRSSHTNNDIKRELAES